MFVAVTAAYLASCFYSFDIINVLERARTDRAQILALDSYAYKIHVSQRLRTPDEVQVALEGSRFTVYKKWPQWVRRDGGTVKVDLYDGRRVEIGSSTLRLFTPERPDPYVITIGNKITPTLEGPAPDWMRISGTTIDARPTLYERVRITRTRVEIQKYFIGWENFLFDFNSPLNGKSWGELWSFVASEPRADADMPNWQFAFSEVWNNEEWQHGSVWYALLQTVVMALVGTIIAALVGLPLAFVAAYNINPVAPVRFITRRLFDILRGIDTLIWSLIFIRAFGLGPLSGIFAIAFTDTGTLGKLFSEAIEGADRKQSEGVKATGAGEVQSIRFGIFPQIFPVFVSQSLYYLESNTRSATIIGALGAGGIGLKLIETLQTTTDWENTMYIILLIILVIVAMDTLSSALRRRLIDGS